MAYLKSRRKKSVLQLRSFYIICNFLDRRCTYTALTEVASTLEAEGIETELIHVGHKDIRGCIGGRKCHTTGKCVFDDLVNETAPKFEESDGIVIGSPVYYASANGTLISFLDRLFYSASFDKSMKVGASVVSARRGGCTATFDELNKYFTISNMPIASSQYWNQALGNTPEEVKRILKDVRLCVHWEEICLF